MLSMLENAFYTGPLLFAFLLVVFISNEVGNCFDYYNVHKVVDLALHKLYFDWIINLDVAGYFVKFAYFLFKIFDQGFLSVLGPDGLTATS